MTHSENRSKQSKFFRLIKLIFVNIFVLIGLILFLNLTAIAIYQLFPGLITTHKEKDYRADLPNYNNVEWAKVHFDEFNSLPTEYRSYVGWRRLPFKGETINIDEQGIRLTPQHERSTDSTALVVFLGGSAMWGTGANDENTIPAHFAKMGNGNYAAVNYAESNYNAYQGYLFLRYHIMTGMRPDIVVSYDGFNERCIPHGRPFSHARDEQIRKVMKGKDRQDRFEYLSFKTIFYRPIKTFTGMVKTKYFAKQKKDQSPVEPGRLREKAKVLLESWLATKHLAEKNNAEFIAVLQPYASCGSPVLSHLESGAKWSSDPYYYYNYVFELLNKPRYQELSDHILDLSNVFDDEEIYYIDFCHVSPNGNKIVAKEMYDYIAENHQNK